MVEMHEQGVRLDVLDVIAHRKYQLIESRYPLTVYDNLAICRFPIPPAIVQMCSGD